MWHATFLLLSNDNRMIAMEQTLYIFTTTPLSGPYTYILHIQAPRTPLVNLVIRIVKDRTFITREKCSIMLSKNPPSLIFFFFLFFSPAQFFVEGKRGIFSGPTAFVMCTRVSMCMYVIKRKRENVSQFLSAYRIRLPLL